MPRTLLVARTISLSVAWLAAAEAHYAFSKIVLGCVLLEHGQLVLS
jgi:hypothetical protein